MEATEVYTAGNYSTTGHWMNYTEDPLGSRGPCETKHLYLSLKVILCVSAVVGNTLVILSVSKFRHMRTIDNILICNLAVSGVFNSLNITTDIFNAVFDIVDLSLKYTCLFKTSDTLMVLVSSVFNLLLMSIERYIAVIHPLRFRAIVTFKRIKVTLALFWGTYVTLSCIPLVGLNTFEIQNVDYADNIKVTDRCNLHNVLLKPYAAGLFVILLLGTTANLGLFIRVMCAVYRSVRKRSQEMRTPKPSNGKTLVVLLTLCSFVICWVPFVAGAVMKAKEAKMIELCWIASPYKIGIVYSSMSWILYGLLRPKFRRCFRAILTCKPLQSRTLYAGTTKESFSNTSTVLRRTMQ